MFSLNTADALLFGAPAAGLLPYVTLTEQTLQLVDFELHDDKGRLLGTLIRTWEEVVVEGPLPLWGRGVRQPAGTVRFMAYVHATRAGAAFGALQDEHVFETVEARDAYIAKRIKDGRKRAAKLAAGR